MFVLVTEFHHLNHDEYNHLEDKKMNERGDISIFKRYAIPINYKKQCGNTSNIKYRITR